MKKLVSLAMVLCISSTLLLGCYGPFKLTKKVYEWNGSLPSKWGKEAMFLVLSVLPVYGFAVVADAVVFNPFEFWGGTNPISSGKSKKTKLVDAGDKQAVFSLSEMDRRLRVDLFNGYRPHSSIIIESPYEGLTVASDGSGRIVMTARTLLDGSIVVHDAEGREVAHHLPPAE
jgi:hypothetical protein